MKKMAVNCNADYAGQNMAWTESITGKTAYKKGHVFFHFSDKKVNCFAEKLTCFFDNNKNIEGYCYILILKSNKVFDNYSDEVRINITESRNGNLFNIFYVGKISTKEIRNEEGILIERKYIDNRKF